MCVCARKEERGIGRDEMTGSVCVCVGGCVCVCVEDRVRMVEREIYRGNKRC